MNDPSAAPAPRAQASDSAPRRGGSSTLLGPALFLIVIVSLAAIAIVSLRPPRPMSGLAADPRVAEARAALHGRIAVPTNGLRFTSALFGEPLDEEGERAGAATIAEAARRLETARASHPLDPRVLAAIAALDLARLRLDAAERSYRLALDLASHYPEARLGLGVVLAMRAETEPDAGRAQGLRLRAVSQFAAVPEGAAEYPAALYDRALELDRAGRRSEALRFAADYWRRAADDRWTERLRAALRPER
jgi:tetratricopeptide (TPR) repeat protein